MNRPIKQRTEADYRAESDAHTLAHAQEIMADKARHARARKHAMMQSRRMAMAARVVPPVAPKRTVKKRKR